MALDTLRSLVTQAALAAGASVTLPHGLVHDGHSVQPDEVTCTNPFLKCTASTTTTVTIVNNGGIAYDVLALCEAWHPIARLFGQHGQDGQFGQRLQAAAFTPSGYPAPTTGSIVYGSGQDGTAVFDGINVFPFATLAGPVYTLTRDIFIGDQSRNLNGITIDTAGFKGFCSGYFHNEVGSLIRCDGKDAVAGAAGGSSALGTLGIGVAGGNGRANNTGLPGTNMANTLQDANLAGGAGGAGGANAGGAGGTYTTTAANGGANFLTPMLTGFLFNTSSGGNQATVTIIGGGAGGGGGGSNNGGVTGGGGGGGGGVLVWHAFILQNDGTIRARGGAGAAASGVGGDGGGGGGGGGGMILSLAWRRTGAGLYVVDGGTAGAPVGAGVAGTPGHIGHVNLFAGTV